MTAFNEETDSASGSSDVPFASLGLEPRLLAALETLGYTEPTSIQREAIPPLLAGRDLLGQAATGTGKTAAFALPLIHRLAEEGRSPPGAPAALVLVPTRELAMQVADSVQRYGQGSGVRALAIYGGASFVQQQRALARGIDLVVATPGRALDHIRRETLRLDRVGMVVLDEADEMLDMGFAEDLEAILGGVPAERITALFSATLPPRVAGLSRRYLRDPIRIRIEREEESAEGESPRVRQVVYVVTRPYKVLALARILEVESPTSAMIFCRTRTEVDALAEALNAKGYRAEALHGGLSQDQRDRVMRGFRSGGTPLLVATDVAARGLDVSHVSHVVNYDLPNAPESYVHRIGRTGRAGRDGVAITLIEPRERRMLRILEERTGDRIVLSTVPTVAELRERRLGTLRAAVHDAIEEEAEDARILEVVDSLANEFGATEVAVAAMRLLLRSEKGREEDEIEIPTAPPPRREEPYGSRKGPPTRRGVPLSRRGPGGHSDLTRIRIAGGHALHIRPGDIVGAIVNEAGVPASSIGAIHIDDHFSTVELPERAVDFVIRALSEPTPDGPSPDGP